jgi:RHS repeat-associated protein
MSQAGDQSHTSVNIRYVPLFLPMHQATYTYDALDRRIGIDDDNTQTWTVFDGQEPYADFTGSGSLAMRYLAAPGALGAPLARTNSGGTTAWYLTDHLGSVRDVVTNSGGGTVIDHVDYDGFGNIADESSPSSGDRFKYAGMVYDVTVGIDLTIYRSYNPATGRFEQQDPLGFHGKDFDLYRYTNNNTLNAVDPSGEFWFLIVLAGAALLVGGGCGGPAAPPVPPPPLVAVPGPPVYTHGTLPADEGTSQSPKPTGLRPINPLLMKPYPLPRPNVPRSPIDPVAPHGSGDYVTVTNKPAGQIVGVTGADPCVGVVLRPPKGSPYPYVAVHFAATNNPSAFLSNYQGMGYVAIITGAGTDPQGWDLLNKVIKSIHENHIDYQGYVPHTMAGVDENGQVYAR